LDGTGIEDVLVDLDYPYGMAVDATAGKMYWARELYPGDIRCANLDGTDEQVLVTTGVFYPHGLAIDVEGGKVYWCNEGTGRIKRANLDGSDFEDIVVGENSLFGIAIDSSCVYEDPDDFDEDGIPDDCDSDIDNDGVLNSVDVCDYTPPGMSVDSDGRPRGDMNDDCIVDGLDVQLFVDQLLSQ
jgi:hypothetical protein